MICKFIQTRIGSNLEWFVEQEGTVICNVKAPFERGQINMHLNYTNEMNQRLYFNPSDRTYGASMKDRFSFKLFQGDEMIGMVSAPNKMLKGWFKSYQYREVVINGVPYYLYEVGFGYKGLFLRIYRGDELIAIAEINLVVTNFRDTYTIYAVSVRDLPYMMPLLLHYDVTAHGDITQMAVASVKVTIRNTIQPDLIAKYDPEFIPRIKAMHGIE